MKKISLLFLAVTLLMSCKNDQNSQETVNNGSTEPREEMTPQKEIAMANGLKEFDNIENLEFTFNVEVNDTLRSSRHWKWNTKTGKISMTEKDSTITYTKNDSVSESVKYIDQRFINDTYWLLFPYQLEWSDANISKVSEKAAPISGDTLQMLTASYPSEGGYTPGDSYDIYFNEDNMIQEWVYKSANGKREMPTTWEDYEDHKGLKIAKMHQSPDGSFKLFFTDIKVE